MFLGEMFTVLAEGIRRASMVLFVDIHSELRVPEYKTTRMRRVKSAYTKHVLLLIIIVIVIILLIIVIILGVT